MADMGESWTREDSLSIARQAAAQAWCTPKNSHTEMDVNLAEAFAEILANWIDTANNYAKNADFYKLLVDDCARAIGPKAFISDDGTTRTTPVRLRVPELVAEIAIELATKAR